MGFDCNICIESLSNPKSGKADDRLIVTTKCGHLFHSDCLKQWFEKSKTQVWTTRECPVCNNDLSPPTDLIRIYTTANDDGSPSIDDYRQRIIKLEQDKNELGKRLEIAFLQQREVEKKNTRLQKDMEKASKEVQGYSNLSRQYQSDAAKWKSECEELKNTVINLSKKVAEPTMNQFFPHPNGSHPMSFGLTPQYGGQPMQNMQMHPPSPQPFQNNFRPRFSNPNPKYTNPPRFEKKKHEKTNGSKIQNNGNSSQSSADVDDDEFLDKLVNEGSTWRNTRARDEEDVEELASGTSISRNLKGESRRNEKETKSRSLSPTDDVLNSMLNGGSAKQINRAANAASSPPHGRTNGKNSSDPAIGDGKPPTPYQGNRQVFGKYFCTKCDAKWGSHKSYVNKPQTCLYCRESVYPYSQAPIIPRHELNKQ